MKIECVQEETVEVIWIQKAEAGMLQTLDHKDQADLQEHNQTLVIWAEEVDFQVHSLDLWAVMVAELVEAEEEEVEVEAGGENQVLVDSDNIVTSTPPDLWAFVDNVMVPVTALATWLVKKLRLLYLQPYLQRLYQTNYLQFSI